MTGPVDVYSNLGIAHVSNVAPTWPKDGDLWFDTSLNVLKIYNAGSWTSISGGGGGGGPMKLNDLTDVTVSDPVGVDGMVLRYDSMQNKWINDQDVDGGSY